MVVAGEVATIEAVWTLDPVTGSPCLIITQAEELVALGAVAVELREVDEGPPCVRWTFKAISRRVVRAIEMIRNDLMVSDVRRASPGAFTRLVGLGYHVGTMALLSGP